MKAKFYSPGNRLLWQQALRHYPVLAGASAVSVLLLGGCATYQTGTLVCGDPVPLPEPCRLQLGTIALVAPANAAEISFSQSEGQIETFGDRAGVAAASVLDPSGASVDPGAQAVLGIGGVVAAPFAAVVAGWSARERLRPDQLSECEANLLQALKEMAAQRHFRDWLVKAADEKAGRRLIPVESSQTVGRSCPEAKSVMEAQVHELRLERTGKHDTSYALHIKATARLVRAADGAVLYERPVEYRSGTCLFLDWTLDNSLQKVAETGYREMAERLVDQLFVATPEGPLLAGPGYKKSRAPAEHGLVARIAADTGARNGVSRASAHYGKSERQPSVQLASFPVANTGTIGVYSPETPAYLTFGKPMTRDEAAVEATRDMERMFDGLYNHPNPVISLTTIGLAVPVGVLKQGQAVVRGLTDREFRKADAALAKAVHQAHPEDDLALQVAAQLAPVTSQPVLVASRLKASELARKETEWQVVTVSSSAAKPRLQRVANTGMGQGVDTVIEIRVLSAGLSPKDGINPPMTLCVEAEARLSRTRDGQGIYSCPVHYRSRAHHFTAWAAKDAQLFRQEWQRCYGELGSHIARQLVARRLIEPDRVAYPTLATQ